jgi:signal transduction histidine kinase/HAMP domain-containing protein
MPRWGGLSYGQQQVLSLLVLATLPLAIVVFVVLGVADQVVRAETNQRGLTASRAVQSIMADDASTLDRLATAYAAWQPLQRDVAALDEADIAGTVVDFSVGQGTADAAVVVVGDLAVSDGSDGAPARLESMLRAALGAPGNPTGTSYADLSDGVYAVAIRRIDVSALTGPGVAAARQGQAGIVVARRLGSSFVIAAKRLTDFDVSVYGTDGRLTAASSLALAGETGPLGITATSGSFPFQLGADEIAVAIPLSNGAGAPVGSVVVGTQLALLTAIGPGLVPYLAAIFTLTVVFALALAVYLASLLRRRLAPIQQGINAVAAGDLAVRLPSGHGDEIGRLAASHNRLAETLQRRDRVIWRSLDALEGLRPERGPADVANSVVDAGRSIFELRWCGLLDADDSVLASSPANEPPPPGRVSAEVEAVPGVWLEGVADPGREWVPADRALFGLFAREAGVALRSAGLHEADTRRVERLGQANEIQREFVRGVGHNLQGPLARILMSAEQLESTPALGDGTRAQVAALHDDADRLTRVVRELLTSTRLDAGVFVPAVEPFAVGPAVRRAWRAVASERQLDLADGSEGWLAVGDREAVEQVLWILLDNAVRYAPSGPVHVSVQPSEPVHASVLPSEPAAPTPTSSTPAEVVVRVRDEGPGVPPGERAAIFRRFQRGSTSAGQDGTGLGLDVARRLVRAMGGALRYEDTPEGGATFAFTLPAEPAERQE